MLSRNPSVFSLSGLLRGVLRPCNSPELCLSKQETSQQERRETGELHSSGLPPALLLTVRYPLLAPSNPTAVALGRVPSPACILGRSRCHPAAGRLTAGTGSAR